MIDGSPPPVLHNKTLVWQATFLTTCRRLSADLAQHARIVALIRDPRAIVWSMLNNWAGLDDMSLLLGRLGYHASHEREPDRAIAIVEAAWTNLETLAEGLPDKVVFLSYGQVTTDSAQVFPQLVERLGVPFKRLPAVDPRALDSGALLDGESARRVQERLRARYERLERRCAAM